MSEEQNEEPKIIIDEDYKSQVEREKAEFRQKQAEEDAAKQDDIPDQEDTASESSGVTEETASEQTAAEASEEDPGDVPPPPPASLEFLVTSLATQAMASMGQIPGEDGKPMPKNMAYAKHFIDLLGVLEEKTKGNLSEDEDKFLSGTLHQMRMIFVQMS